MLSSALRTRAVRETDLVRSALPRKSPAGRLLGARPKLTPWIATSMILRLVIECRSENPSSVGPGRQPKDLRQPVVSVGAARSERVQPGGVCGRLRSRQKPGIQKHVERARNHLQVITEELGERFARQQDARMPGKKSQEIEVTRVSEDRNTVEQSPGFPSFHIRYQRSSLKFNNRKPITAHSDAN